MKKLLLILLIAPVLGFGQGEQRYADGTATDQDGNTFEWINYGDLDWAIENAEVVTYRDGTPIPHVSNASEWSNLTTGAWCYHSNDPTKGKLYNWYAVAGIYDEASLSNETLRKEFAPDGWVVPSFSNWSNLRLYLIDNGYNFDGTTTGNKIAKSMASTSIWDISDVYGSIGNDKSLNNRSGFNSFPNGFRDTGGYSGYGGSSEVFWSISTIASSSWYYKLDFNANDLKWNYNQKKFGFSARFVRNASTASVEKHAKAITVYPNPTSSTIDVQQEFSVAKVYDLSGKELLKSNSKTIDLSELPSSVYLLRLYDNSNKVLGATKVVKQ
jgi:uncharacterized protein (TIGR02145 family)